jgi:type IV secretory pathway VirB10-like protein
METSKAGLAALGVAALLASAGAGAFIASRAAGPAAVAVPATTPNPAPGAAVEATEAVVEDPALPAPAGTPVKPAPAPVAAPAARPAESRVPQAPRRVEARRPAPSIAPASAPVRPATPSPAPRAQETERASTVPPVAPATERPVEAPVAEVYRGAPSAAEGQAPEERRPIEPPAPRFEEVTVPADAVIGLQLESTITSDTARIEDRVNAKVTRDVRAEGRVAIPAGSRVIGSVSEVDRGGKMRERARLGVRFHTVILADGTELPLQTETVVRLGESPGNASAAKVGGGAIGGAILGAILGGGKGAAIGAGVGAGAGTAAVMAGGRRAAQIQAGSPMTVKILSPVSVTVER